LVAAVLVRLAAFGVLGLLAYPPLSLAPLIFIAFVPYIDAVRLVEEAASRGEFGRLPGVLIYVGGSFFFWLSLHWLVFLPAEEVTIPGLMIPATIVAGLYLGAYAFVAQWLARRANRIGVPLGLAVPVAWVATEYLRTVSQFGCPWALLGYGLTATPVFMQTASMIGVFGVSLIVALVNGLVYSAGRGRHRLASGLAALAVVAALWVHGQWVIDREPPDGQLEVALIQPNIGRDRKFVPEFRVANIERMLLLSELALIDASPRDGAVLPPDLKIGDPAVAPELIIWPETATPCRLRHDRGCQALLQHFVDRTGVPLFTGFPAIERPRDWSSRHWNSSALLMPGQGISGQYHKVNLVPFGEAIPYQETLTWLKKIDFGEADFTRGPGFEPIQFPAGGFGVMICYESIFPEAGRVAARRGATFFVNITNDEWFGRSAGPYQHAAMAAVRSIECRRGLARCANTGVTFVVDRYGRVSFPTPLYEERVVSARVDQGTQTTLYMRAGDIVPQACLGLAILGGVLGHRRRPRNSGGA
jgi:apolipoprotein N-acyltransferase